MRDRPLHEVVPQPGSAGRCGYVQSHLMDSLRPPVALRPTIGRQIGLGAFTHVVEMFTYQDSKRQLSKGSDGLREIHCQVRRRYLLLKMSGSGMPAQHVTHPN